MAGHHLRIGLQGFSCAAVKLKVVMRVHVSEYIPRDNLEFCWCHFGFQSGGVNVFNHNHGEWQKQQNLVEIRIILIVYFFIN